jgi:hypothetical protein
LPFTAQPDIWALGVMLYTVIAGCVEKVKGVAR